MRNEASVDAFSPEGAEVPSDYDAPKGHTCKAAAADKHSSSGAFELCKRRRRTVVVRRETFLDIVCSSLSEYNYVGANQRADLVLACR